MHSFKYKKVLLPLVWIAITVSLGSWWLFLGLRQNRMATELASIIGGIAEQEVLDKLERQSVMIKMEGAFFLLMLVAGGITLVWLTFREDKRNKLIQDFFSTVTHEMKTPLASLRLQVESLLEESPNPSTDKLLYRLLKDSVRIESQMTKALYLASLMRSEGLYLEDTNLPDLEESFKDDWSELTLITDWTSASVKADRKALESVFRNLLENSVQHGKATEVKISTEPAPGGRVKFAFRDNGIGFRGDLRTLGRPFIRHTSTSGTGIGLYIVKNLIKKMGGNFVLRASESGGFRAEWTLSASEKGARSV
ncbi:GHKL domain protein [Leptospira fainei serovar Hurstbridge str. BUT 6]|uniref:histidine kinase n=1 Tax=Leptospira fainei serovar Hurstbridge str. BUT 6 TaxID=1193011 RepID=S3UQ74_9LEPT|nr:HAMP domain-containing sensor histidine kinase [Leptospira fainei]EPG72551.1 GHKL domain protein [Leptospira fainei serovar Hurstbridge str. BUT 6]